MGDLVKGSLEKQQEQENGLLNTRGNKAVRPCPSFHVPKTPWGTPVDGSEKVFPSAKFIKEAPKSNERVTDPLLT